MDGFTWAERISSDEDVVDRFLHEGSVTPRKPDVADLWTAVEWLALYGAEDAEQAQPFANAIGFLLGSIRQREERSRLAARKRAYAQALGVPVSTIRKVH
jgi:hypothetical protein